MKAAYQGEPGAFSEEAISRVLVEATSIPLPSFDAVFEAIVDGSCDRAVVPIENSLFGSVHQNVDLLHEHELVIIAETQLRIRHQLMGFRGTSLDSIRTIRSHPQAIGQCRSFLRSRMGHAQVIPAHDTAGAARLVAEGRDPSIAAIAGRGAADRYGLDILAEDIESDEANFTRFLVLARQEDDPDLGLAPDVLDVSTWKTSVVYAQQQNVPGGLYKSLAVFAEKNIDLMRIESRPLVGHPGSYVFHLDLAGGSNEEPVQTALSRLEELASRVTILGTYRSSRRPV